MLNPLGPMASVNLAHQLQDAKTAQTGIQEPKKQNFLNEAQMV